MEDKVLKTLVEAELEWEPSIDAADIGITVEDGIVGINGHVPNYAQKIAAEAAVKRVKGVRGFVEHLQVRSAPSPHSGHAVASRLASILDWTVEVPANQVKVKVENGIVTLVGKVDWQFQKAAAEQAVRLQQGVRGVLNEIQVQPHAQASDIKRRITAALERRADIEANQIVITVAGDTVRLDGKVRAWFERDVIERAVWAAPGVAKVDDHIAVGL
jgi:osmotically-inducible protein OsmY